MYVCMYVCIYIYILYVCMYVYIHVCMYVCIYIYIYIYISGTSYFGESHDPERFWKEISHRCLSRILTQNSEKLL